jgi:hypothetical protein
VSQISVERYLRLGLQLGRHVEGIVDAYYGPPEVAAAVNAEPPADPRTLVAEAEALLEELEDIQLFILALHETYPGHHTERCCKEQLLVRGRGLLEETLVLAPTAQSVVTEGIGNLAPSVLLDGGGGEALAAVVRDAGIELDLAHAGAVERALEPCRWAEVNAALMLHEEGASEAEARRISSAGAC